MTDLIPNDLSHLSDEEFNALAPQGYHATGPAEPRPTEEELITFFEQHDWNHISPETFCEIAQAVLDAFGAH